MSLDFKIDRLDRRFEASTPAPPKIEYSWNEQLMAERFGPDAKVCQELGIRRSTTLEEFMSQSGRLESDYRGFKLQVVPLSDLGGMVNYNLPGCEPSEIKDGMLRIVLATPKPNISKS